MKDPIVIGVIILLACIFLGRIISEKALAKINPDEKLLLVDSFSKIRTYNLIPIIILLILFFSAEYLSPSLSSSIYTAFIIATVSFMVVLHIIIFRKLRKLGIPPSYVKTYALSRAVVGSGLLIWVGIIVFN